MRVAPEAASEGRDPGGAGRARAALTVRPWAPQSALRRGRPNAGAASTRGAPTSRGTLEVQRHLAAGIPLVHVGDNELAASQQPLGRNRHPVILHRQHRELRPQDVEDGPRVGVERSFERLDVELLRVEDAAGLVRRRAEPAGER